MYLCCPKDLLAAWQIHISTSRWTRSCSTAGSIPLSLKGKTIIFIPVELFPQCLHFPCEINLFGGFFFFFVSWTRGIVFTKLSSESCSTVEWAKSKWVRYFLPKKFSFFFRVPVRILSLWNYHGKEGILDFEEMDVLNFRTLETVFLIWKHCSDLPNTVLFFQKSPLQKSYKVSEDLW